ncbi:MAG: hypothetical protein ACHQQS_04835 [Thermoanaerobaculales bacterium]
MTSELALRPLVRWDGFTLRIDLDIVELLVNRVLEARASVVRRVLVEGDHGALDLHVTAAWRGLPAQLSARISELRLHRRCFGCRVASLHGPLGLPLPLTIVAGLVRRLDHDLIHFDAEDGILLVDLRRYLPEGLEVRVDDVQCRGRWLEVSLAGGSVAAVLAAPAVVGD